LIRFRPYPGLTVTTLIMVAILCGLGVWQLQRLAWKEALIATVSSHMLAKAVSLDDALRMSADEVQYRKVALSGHFDNAKENYVFTTGAGGAPVYHVLTPFITDDAKGHARVLMVDRGEIPQDRLSPQSRSALEGETRLAGVWRVPDAPGFFTPKPEPARHVWYARDLAGIAAADGIILAAPVVIEADSRPNPGGWPRGGQTVVDFPNNHLSYAITWFGLAAGLIGVYLAYHISKGRLGPA
jgi:surfeit locus 1 family protein